MTPSDYENLRVLFQEFRAENSKAHDEIKAVMGECEDRLRGVEVWKAEQNGASKALERGKVAAPTVMVHKLSKTQLATLLAALTALTTALGGIGLAQRAQTKSEREMNAETVAAAQADK